MAVATPQSPSRQQESIVGISRQECHKIRYTWIIENFKHVMLHKKDDEIISPEFEDPITHETTWRLEMGYWASSPPYISLFARLMSTKKISLNVNLKLSIVDGNEKEILNFSKTRRGVEKGSLLGFNYFLKHQYFWSNLQTFLIQKHLKIKCRICLIGEITKTDMDYDCLKIPQHELSEDYEKLLSNTSTSDIVLSLGNREVKCHKAVLTARSPVFAAMLRHDFKEKKQNKINIEGMEYKVLEDMIWFIYTGRVKDVDQISVQLLEAANQYALESLKGICDKHLAQGLSVESAVDILLCADRTSSERLKLQAKRFINRNLKEIVKTESWASLVISNKSLLNEVL